MSKIDSKNQSPAALCTKQAQGNAWHYFQVTAITILALVILAIAIPPIIKATIGFEKFAAFFKAHAFAWELGGAGGLCFALGFCGGSFVIYNCLRSHEKFFIKESKVL